MKKIFRYLTITVLIFVAQSIQAQSKKVFTVRLDYTPRLIKSPELKVNLSEKPLAIKDFTDNRVEDRAVVGEHKNKSIQTPSPLDVAFFTGNVFKKCFAEWGGVLKQDAFYSLEAEVTNFYAVDPYLYKTQVNILFTLKNDKNEKIWSGVEMGEARVFGRSLSRKNYNEGFSDATQEAFIRLFEDDNFIAAWYGNQLPATAALKKEEAKAEAPAATNAPTPSVLIKKQLVQLVEADFKEDALLAYVKQRSLSADLTADEMVEWKNADIPQSVITEVIKSTPSSAKNKDSQ